MYSGINISQTDARPMYLQIMEQIRARIAAGDWPPGKELPSIRALAAALNVSVITIKRAYLDLENEGVIVTRHGKGSFVAEVNGLAGELQEEQLEEHLTARRRDRPILGLSEEDLAARLRRAHTQPGQEMNGHKHIEMRGVRKTYRFFTLDDLSLDLAPGEVMGFVGPNGAGKSTTLRLAMGFIAPDAGEVRVLGHAMPEAQAVAKRDIGYRVRRHAPAAARDARLAHGVRQVHLPGLGRRLMRRRWCKRFNLRPEQNVKGAVARRARQGRAAAGAGAPPTPADPRRADHGPGPGGTPRSISEFMDVLRDDSRSILFSSHNTVDVERISDRITFIDRGRIVDSSNKEDFLERWRRIQLQLPPGASLPELPNIVGRVVDGQFVTLTTNQYLRGLIAR